MTRLIVALLLVATLTGCNYDHANYKAREDILQSIKQAQRIRDCR